jgi:RecA-family ATPase
MPKLKRSEGSPEQEEEPSNEPSKEIWLPPTLDTWLAEVDESQEWHIDRIIPRDALVLISGHQKRAYKTWFSFLAGLVVASGRAQSLFNPLASGPVIIVEEEGARPQTKQRFQMLCNTYGFTDADLKNVFFSHRQRVKLDDPAWRKKLIDAARHIQPALVIYDALSYAHTGDENSHADMAPVIDTLQALRQTGSSVAILAHLDKARGENPRADIDTQVRGSSIVVNAYDMHLALRRYKMAAAHIDLIARARDAAEARFSVTWDVSEETNTARFNMLEVLDGEPKDTTIDKYKALLETSRGPWSSRGLRELWQCSTKTEKVIRTKLIESGVLVEKGNAFSLASGESESA